MKSRQCDWRVTGEGEVNPARRPSVVSLPLVGRGPIAATLGQFTALTIFSSWFWITSLPAMTWPFQIEPVVPA